MFPCPDLPWRQPIDGQKARGREPGTKPAFWARSEPGTVE
jgi:hypothetical protein